MWKLFPNSWLAPRDSVMAAEALERYWLDTLEQGLPRGECRVPRYVLLALKGWEVEHQEAAA